MKKTFETVRRHFWKWRIESEDMLDPWFEHFPEYEALPVKRNAVRSVFRVTDAAGREYFVKHDSPKGVSASFKALFRCKAKKEFLSCRLLHALSIPCVDCVGWGRRFPEGMLLSRALENSVTVLEYWFRSAAWDPVKKKAFLQELAGFIRRFVDARIIHRDFHAGNVMYCLSTGRMCLVDPYGVRQSGKPLEREHLRSLMNLFVHFRGELTIPEIREFACLAGLAENPEDAMALWNETVVIEEEKIRKQWKKRVRQILSGSSKFAQETIGEDGSRIFRRNSLWYTPPPQTEDLKSLLSSLKAVQMEHSQAQLVWLDSFLAQLMRKRIDEIPQAWVIPPETKTDASADKKGPDPRRSLDTLYF